MRTLYRRSHSSTRVRLRNCISQPGTPRYDPEKGLCDLSNPVGLRRKMRLCNRRGISTLEKIFLGTIMLFACVILALFSLYFDVADMFKGGLESSSGFTMGMHEHQEDGERRRGASIEIMPSDGLGNSKLGVPSSWAGFVGYAYSGSVRNEKATFLRSRKKALRKKGIRNEELLNMLAKSEYRMAIRRHMQDVDVAIRQQDYEGAIRTLKEAIQKTDRENFLLLSEYYSRLREVYFVYMKDYSKATEATSLLRNIQKQITRIQALG